MTDLKVTVNYKPEPHQSEIHHDESRYRVVCAGRKFGKSVLARQELIRQALLHPPEPQEGGVYQPPNFWIVSPTIKQGKQNHWTQLKRELQEIKITNPEGGPTTTKTVSKRNEVDLLIKLFNGCRIQILGAENAERIRGAGVRGMVIDEAAYISERVWEQVLEPEIMSTKGWVLMISTPAGFNWFHDVYQRGIKGNDNYTKEWSSYHFTSFDTPRVDKDFLTQKQKECSPETFAQEYLAEFTKLEGLIYTEFLPRKHVIEPIELDPHWHYYRALDFGHKDPTVCLFFAVTPEGRIYLYDELYTTKETTVELCEDIRARSYGKTFLNTFADPTGAQWIADFNENKIPTTAANKETKTTKKLWRNYGIDLVKGTLRNLLPDGKPQLQIFDDCTNSIREFRLYSWKENPHPELNHPGIPERANNHCMDSLRYFRVSYQRPTSYRKIEDDIADRNWSFRNR